MPVFSLNSTLRVYTFALALGAIAVAAAAPLAGPQSQATSLLALTPFVIWIVLHGWIVRGGAATVQFLLIAGGLVLAAAMALAVTDGFYRGGVALPAQVPVHMVVAWIVCTYAALAVTSTIIQPGANWWTVVPSSLIAGLVTAALDLVVDPIAVTLGSITYSHGGAFLPEIEGTNQAHGIPLTNYVAWLAVAAAAYLIIWWRSRHLAERPVRGRVEALVFYVAVFAAPAIVGLRLGHPELLLIGGVPVALVSSLLAHRLIGDRRARLTVLRGNERGRVARLIDRRSANHRH